MTLDQDKKGEGAVNSLIAFGVAALVTLIAGVLFQSTRETRVVVGANELSRQEVAYYVKFTRQDVASIIGALVVTNGLLGAILAAILFPHP